MKPSEKVLAFWLVVAALVFIYVLSVDNVKIKVYDSASKCSEMGGIPIKSPWNGSLADCIFKPTSTPKP